MTKKLLFVTGFLVCLILLPLAAENQLEERSPTAVLTAYCDALKNGDIETAKKLTATFNSLPPGSLDRQTLEYSQRAKTGDFKITIVTNSVKVSEDCAVVTFKDGDKNPPDYDPAFLIKQEGKWKVFLGFTVWRRPDPELSAEQKNRLKDLEDWFDKESDRLYGR